MKSIACLVVAVAVVGRGVAVQGQLILDISCQGMESGGGSQVLQYQYELHNPTAAPVVITSFAVGTDDLNVANYTAWTVPVGVGFNWAQVVAPRGVWTDGVKTAHGALAPQPTKQTLGTVRFVETTGNGMTIPAGGTATFGFNNPNPSEDVEWITTVNMSVWNAPVAGPMGVYSLGPVHAPVPEPTRYAFVVGLSAFGFVVWRRFIRTR